MRLAAAVGAAVVAVASAGDGFVVAGLLAVAAAPAAGLVTALAMIATVARWGTADLGAVAGDQDVLGAAVTVGPALAAVSSGLAALALVLLPVTARRAPRPVALAVAVAAGCSAAALAAGPAVTQAADAGVRAGATVVAVGLALVVTRRPPPAWLALLAAAAAVGCAVP